MVGLIPVCPGPVLINACCFGIVIDSTPIIKAGTPILWPPDADSFEKTLMLGKINRRRR